MHVPRIRVVQTSFVVRLKVPLLKLESHEEIGVDTELHIGCLSVSADDSS